MAKIVITIEDVNEGVITYKSECETPQETNQKGEPTLAIQLGANIIQQLTNMNENRVEYKLV